MLMFLPSSDELCKSFMLLTELALYTVMGSGNHGPVRWIPEEFKEKRAWTAAKSPASSISPKE